MIYVLTKFPNNKDYDFYFQCETLETAKELLDNKNIRDDIMVKINDAKKSVTYYESSFGDFKKIYKKKK